LILVAVIIILVYLISAGHIKIGSEKEPKNPKAAPNGNDHSDVQGHNSSQEKGKNENADSSVVNSTDLIKNKIDKKHTNENPLREIDVSLAESSENHQNNDILLEKANRELAIMQRKERRIKRLVNISFALVRICFALIFVGYNLFIIYDQDLQISIHMIGVLAPYNNWMIVAIGVLLFVMYKSPANLKSSIHQIHHYIEKIFMRRHPHLRTQITTLEDEIDLLIKSNGRPNR